MRPLVAKDLMSPDVLTVREDLPVRELSNFFLDNVLWAITLEDVFAGLVKTFAFGWIIAMVGCFQALETTGGTVGVGRATTAAVVIASISVLVSDFFLTKLLMVL